MKEVRIPFHEFSKLDFSFRNPNAMNKAKISEFLEGKGFDLGKNIQCYDDPKTYEKVYRQKE